MKFIDELWKIIQSDDWGVVRDIAEEDLLNPERLGYTSYEKAITLMKIAITNIKQRKYEEASSYLKILSMSFDSMLEIVGTPYDDSIKIIAGDDEYFGLARCIEQEIPFCEIENCIRN